MPAPSQVTAQDINTEIGYSSTASVNLNETRVRNLACKSSGQISFGDCRWGINFPGGEFSNPASSLTKTYDTNSILKVTTFDSRVYDGSAVSTAGSYLRFYSNGTMQLESTTFFGQSLYHGTWLTSGSAGDYTVQFQVTSGALSSGSAASNTDLAMSTTRTFLVFGNVGPNSGIDYQSAVGNIIIKDSGGTLITRPTELIASAEVFV